ncbi:hypothetical protein DM01DRAFT_1339721 [Hesseltinella vesiculosa]|uniref:Uncharacterized protein n=1 Tax=Hesseltinella vesiculosa TaxID=101127 RepID=A0A1X2G669_9FUNG|nr:hypothetical protein DM01DRAFT_1339721 [Hesseltinella vesiculosa]
MHASIPTIPDKGIDGLGLMTWCIVHHQIAALKFWMLVHSIHDLIQQGDVVMSVCADANVFVGNLIKFAFLFPVGGLLMLI